MRIRSALCQRAIFLFLAEKKAELKEAKGDLVLCQRTNHVTFNLDNQLYTYTKLPIIKNVTNRFLYEINYFLALK